MYILANMFMCMRYTCIYKCACVYECIVSLCVHVHHCVCMFVSVCVCMTPCVHVHGLNEQPLKSFLRWQNFSLC